MGNFLDSWQSTFNNGGKAALSKRALRDAALNSVSLWAFFSFDAWGDRG